MIKSQQTSLNSGVVKVSDMGPVTPVGNGTLTISAVTKVGIEKTPQMLH